MRQPPLHFLGEDSQIKPYLHHEVVNTARKLDRIHFVPEHSSINPDNITITQTYDPRYQIITTIRKKGEDGFFNKTKTFFSPPY